MSITTVHQSTKERTRCHPLHIERARQGFTMCIDCRRPLFPAPKSKCVDHGIYCCSDCFTSEQIDAFGLQRTFGGGQTP